MGNRPFCCAKLRSLCLCTKNIRRGLLKIAQTHQNVGVPRIGDTPYFTNRSGKNKSIKPFSKKIYVLIGFRQLNEK